MRFRKSDKSVTPDENTTSAEELEPVTATDPAAALALAEAEAAAAEATAEAARVRAAEIRLKSEGDAPTAQEADAVAEPADTGAVSQGDETDETAEAAEADDVTEAAEADDVTEADAAPPQQPVAPRTGVGRALRWAAATVAILSIGALVTVSVLMVIHHRGVEAHDQRAAEYAAAAKQSVVTLMSLDFNSVDEDVKRIIENSTGDFRKEFEEQATDFATVAKESKVVTEATATAAAVESMTDTDAVVLVTATSTVTNTSGADQEPRTWRLTVNLTRDGDQIKMSKVEFAP